VSDEDRFCRHWTDDCEKVCKCGHACTLHEFDHGQESGSACEECGCSCWREAMSEIKPALTAEEWVEGRTANGNVYTTIDGVLWLESGDKKLIVVSSRAKMAALCLHNQPFGFTRDMLRALRELGHPSQTMESMDLADAAIDRIEALLPQEEK